MNLLWLCFFYIVCRSLEKKRKKVRCCVQSVRVSMMFRHCFGEEVLAGPVDMVGVGVSCHW